MTLWRRPFAVTGATGSGDAFLAVRLVGGSSGSHHVTVMLNDQPLGDAQWSGLVPFGIEFPVSASSLLNGENTVKLQALRDSDVIESFVYVDSFDLTYERQFRAVDDRLRFAVPNGSDVIVGGFSAPEVVVLDITTPSQPVLVTGVAAAQAPDGSYEIHFGAVGNQPMLQFETVLSSRARVPTRLSTWSSAGLWSDSNAGDYLLIAPVALGKAARRLADYRSGQGLATRVVFLEDIYDEFGFGLAEAPAIRTFLRHARANWATPPRYVTLVGRGSYDYKDVRGLGDNLIPTLLATSPEGLFASDVLFADLEGDDGRPEIALGRLPVLTAQELNDYTAKIQAHEATAAGEWQRQILLTADNPDAAGNFTADSETLAAMLPAAGYSATSVYLDVVVGRRRKAEDHLDAINDPVSGGASVFNYIGHGSLTYMADERLCSSVAMCRWTRQWRSAAGLPGHDLCGGRLLAAGSPLSQRDPSSAHGWGSLCDLVRLWALREHPCRAAQPGLLPGGFRG